MACLVQTSCNGRIHHAIDFAEEPNRLRCVLGTELQRIPLIGDQANMSIDALVFLLRIVGKMK